MLVLAIETATETVGVALWGDAGPLASSVVAGSRRHGDLLAPAVAGLLEAAGAVPRDLTAVAVDTGPGLFTGLRVGIATAQALSAALEIPAVGVSSLEVLAHRQRRWGGTLAAVVDARRGEVFRALYRAGAGPLEPLSAAAAISPEALVAELRGLGGAPVLAVGDGAVRYSELLAACAGLELGGPAEAHPDPVALAELAEPRLATLQQPAAGCGANGGGEAGGQGSGRLEACYLREPDVRIGWAVAGG